MYIFLFLLIFTEYLSFAAKLWPRGIIYYIVDEKNYDLYTRSLIQSTLEALEKEICVKFPPAPKFLKPSLESPVLFISNNKKKINCTSQKFNFTRPVVKMTIGYKCFNNKKAVAGNIVHMLRNTMPNKPCNPHSLKLYRKFNLTRTILSPAERCAINHNYFAACMNQTESADYQFQDNKRTNEEPRYRVENFEFYNGRLWPLAAVFYEVQANLRNTLRHDTLARNIAMIQNHTCIKFYDIIDIMRSIDEVVRINGLVFFGEEGSEMPHLGFLAANQTVNITAIATERPGYASHTLNMLMRILGVTMMSNRYDRDSYIFVNHEFIDKDKESYLEKDPLGAWLRLVPYDFKSVTHAPYNYMCSTCHYGKGSIDPLQDDHWEHAITMGQSTQLSMSDKISLELLYNAECIKRDSR